MAGQAGGNFAASSPGGKKLKNSANNSSGGHKVDAKNTKYVGLLSLITFAVLAIAWLTGFLSRLFSVIRFESIIHEFDPW